MICHWHPASSPRRVQGVHGCDLFAKCKMKRRGYQSASVLCTAVGVKSAYLSHFILCRLHSIRWSRDVNYKVRIAMVMCQRVVIGGISRGTRVDKKDTCHWMAEKEKKGGLLVQKDRLRAVKSYIKTEK